MAAWADKPFKLIPIKSIGQSVSPDCLYFSSEMANSHNGLLRSLNSMYLQAHYVQKESDVQDLLQFAIFWEGWIEDHHAGEESLFFPAIARITVEKEIMEKNVKQHHEFISKMKTWVAYVKDCKEKHVEYDSAKFQQLIDAFAPLMADNLSDEIKTLLALNKYDTKAIRAAFHELDLKLREGDKAVLYPIVLGNCDNTYEGGNTWPVLPFFVKYLVHYYFERKYRSVWRFNACTTFQEPRPLVFVPKGGVS